MCVENFLLITLLLTTNEIFDPSMILIFRDC